MTFVTPLIALIAFWLFVYWFRYSCLLILEARLSERRSDERQSAGFRYPTVLARLASSELDQSALWRMRAELEADYQILTQTRLAANDEADPLLRRMLVLDYQMLAVWFSLIRRLSPARASRALAEMSRILGHLAATA